MKTERQVAESLGFIVDTHCYPWLAYKGPHFQPMEKHDIATDVESKDSSNWLYFEANLT